MVTIHNQASTEFRSIGLGALTPYSCVVSEQRNGSFELEMTHPYDQTEKWKRIENGRILYAQTPNGKQPFRIYSVRPTMTELTVNARHIFYDLLDNLCEDMSEKIVPAATLLEQLKSAMKYEMPFVFTTDIEASGSIGGVNQNPVGLLMSDEESVNSFVKAFDCYIVRDHFHVKMQKDSGLDHGILIAYRKNLIGLEVTEDSSDVATRVYPIGKDGLRLSGEGYIDSPYIDRYPYPKIKVLEDSEASSQSDLNRIVHRFYQDGGDLPLVNIKVNFVDLSQTAEYKQYANLEKVRIGDTVTVINKKMGFSKQARVISYEFDSLLQRYNKIELGDFSPIITNSITIGAAAGTVAQSAAAIASEATSSLNGVATIRTEEGIYICVNGTNLESATTYFHFGQGGLRFTNNSGETWTTIIDNNGTIS